MHRFCDLVIFGLVEAVAEYGALFIGDRYEVRIVINWLQQLHRRKVGVDHSVDVT